MKSLTNKQYCNLALDRIGVLLGTDRPCYMLEVLTLRKSKDYPQLSLKEDYSVIEDLAVQDLILKFSDKKLDHYWHMYNVGYFKEATEKYLEEAGKLAS